MKMPRFTACSPGFSRQSALPPPHLALAANPANRGRSGGGSGRAEGRSRSGHQQGSAVIVVMVLLAILLIYIASNLRVLHNLDRDLNLVERREVRRLETATEHAANPAAATNGTP